MGNSRDIVRNDCVDAFASIFVASAYSLCYEPKTAPNFNVTAALGGWHQTYTNELSYLWLESNTYCVQAHYGLNANGTVSVNNTALVGSETSKEIYQILGWATAPNKEKPAQLVVTLQGVPLPAPLWWRAQHCSSSRNKQFWMRALLIPSITPLRNTAGISTNWSRSDGPIARLGHNREN